MNISQHLLPSLNWILVCVILFAACEIKSPLMVQSKTLFFLVKYQNVNNVIGYKTKNMCYVANKRNTQISAL